MNFFSKGKYPSESFHSERGFTKIVQYIIKIVQFQLPSYRLTVSVRNVTDQLEHELNQIPSTV